MYTETHWTFFKTTITLEGEMTAIGEAQRSGLAKDDIQALWDRFKAEESLPNKPVVETSVATPAVETSQTEDVPESIVAPHTSWIEEELAKLKDPEPESKSDLRDWQQKQLDIAKEYRRTHRKQQVERQLLKAKMLAVVDYDMTKEHTVKKFAEMFPERSHDIITEIVVELWQEGKVKGRIAEEQTNRRKNHSTCYYVITSLGNLKTNYYLKFPDDNPWFKRPKK